MVAPCPTPRSGPTGRYLVDAQGRPTFLNGDTAWSHRRLDAARRTATGTWRTVPHEASTPIIVNAIEALFTADPPRTVDGIEPFTRSRAT